MPSLPDAIVPLLSPFASLFDARTWRKVQILLTGVILAPGRRTVTSTLYALGLQEEGDWARYHHVLSRASWSSLAVSRVLLGQLVQHLAPTGPLHLAIDETLERRWGAKIETLGVYRDPVRASHGHFVKAKGLRWVSLMLLAQVSWARRVWALPFLTVLAPSRRDHETRGRRHKTITDWARQMLCLLRRWLPDRDLVVVADRTYATLKLLAACQALTPPVPSWTRLRLDAVLHEPPPPRQPGQKGRPRIVGARQPSLQAVPADPDTQWTDLRQRWPDGTKKHLQAPPARPSGTTRASPPSPCAGGSCATQAGAGSPRPCSAPTPTGPRPPSSPPTCSAGRWRSPSRRCVPTWVWKPSARGRQPPSPAPPRFCWVSSAGSSWLPTAGVGSVPCVPAEPPGRPRPCPPSPMSWPASATPSGPGSRLFPCPRPPPTSKNFPSRRPHRSWPPSATRSDTRPTSPCPHGLCTKSSSGPVNLECDCPACRCRCPIQVGGTL